MASTQSECSKHSHGRRGVELLQGARLLNHCSAQVGDGFSFQTPSSIRADNQTAKVKIRGQAEEGEVGGGRPGWWPVGLWVVVGLQPVSTDLY